ncbi:hypothetical protein QJU93_09835 [Pasteurella skyensis]|uniref:Uncharacterized protein n=1 Tax=Phocoenobacter skyensis TaxID=97481 RepID=A0AAJ6P1F4_9PAST|nr:hypothetical protein [Pasteurella skyensis]MDP8173654.1 hypothetical protein [Pasteurella skyensis]MDP8178022.1 hypothetical protein [Pasteurella skyensis]
MTTIYQFNINVDTPVVTTTEFCRRTGMKEPTLKEKIKNGEIPTMPKRGKELILINWALYTKQALSQPF